MTETTRRTLIGGLAAGAILASEARADNVIPQRAPNFGGSDPGPRDPLRDKENPDLLNPPATDRGALPNLRFSFADAHVRQTGGGWTRQVTERELGVSKTIAGVDMRLNAGAIRELHWHKESEWSYMIYGAARITAIDSEGRNFVEDVEAGDLWYFPSGLPHSIQGLGPDGCEFLLAFDSGGFDEDSTFLLSDWFKHTPPEALAKNFGVPADLVSHTPDPESLYIFAAPIPGPLGPDKLRGAAPVPKSFKHRLLAQDPVRTASGSVRIADASNFPASRTIAAALVEVDPGGMRELHWHPNADEWQYYLGGEGRMTVFGSSGTARTFDYRAGDVGYVPVAMGHYIENTGAEPLRFLELFRSDHYADVSLNQWLALSPPELVQAHLHLDPRVMDALRKTDAPVVPA